MTQCRLVQHRIGRHHADAGMAAKMRGGGLWRSDARFGGDAEIDVARPGRRRNGAEFTGLLVGRSEEHTSELQSLMRNSYAVFCLKKNKKQKQIRTNKIT